MNTKEISTHSLKRKITLFKITRIPLAYFEWNRNFYLGINQEVKKEKKIDSRCFFFVCVCGKFCGLRKTDIFVSSFHLYFRFWKLNAFFLTGKTIPESIRNLPLNKNTEFNQNIFSNKLGAISVYKFKWLLNCLYGD